MLVLLEILADGVVERGHAAREREGKTRSSARTC